MATIMKLARSYEIYSASKKDESELRDTARGGKVVFAGSFKKCMAEAKKRGLTHSK